MKKKKYRIIYKDSMVITVDNTRVGMSIPMTKKEAKEYFEIFDDATEIVKVVKKKHLKSDKSDKEI